MSSTTDRIEKQIHLRAPQARVWRALTSSSEFGTWFGVRIAGEFAVGSHLKGQITIPGYEQCLFEVVVDRMEPEHSFDYRWHPYAVDPKLDYSKEPMTLVEFRLESKDAGTQLTVVESGFDKLPAARRAEAFRMNSGGWEGQLRNIERHVTAR
ncbi:MAG: SRPBCC family protein [Planctomycetota bacterium]